MNIEEIKAWLGQGEDEENRPNWPVTKEKLIEALVTVGIPEETAKSMFTSADPSLRNLARNNQRLRGHSFGYP